MVDTSWLVANLYWVVPTGVAVLVAVLGWKRLQDFFRRPRFKMTWTKVKVYQPDARDPNHTGYSVLSAKVSIDGRTRWCQPVSECSLEVALALVNDLRSRSESGFEIPLEDELRPVLGWTRDSPSERRTLDRWQSNTYPLLSGNAATDNVVVGTSDYPVLGKVGDNHLLFLVLRYRLHPIQTGTVEAVRWLYQVRFHSWERADEPRLVWGPKRF